MTGAAPRKRTGIAGPAYQTYLVFCMLLVSGTQADQVILHAGAILEGTIVSDAGALLQLETPSGTLPIPRSAIARRIKGPTRWERYRNELAAEPLTAKRHIAIARWCEENNLPRRRLAHIDAALERSPTDPEALREAGYVPIADLWIKATPPAVDATIDTASSNGRQAQVQASPSQSAALAQLQLAWLQHARVIHDSMLTSAGRDRAPGDRRREEGLQTLLTMDHPLGIAAACHAMSEGSENTRTDLVTMLDQVGGDLATLNLLALALADASEQVRRSAAESLARRDDVRIDLALRRALYCQSATVVERAAGAIGMGNDADAAIDVIQAMERNGGYAEGPDIATLLLELEALFGETENIPIGEHGIALAHRVLVTHPDVTNRRPMPRADTKSGLRTGLQQALIDLTGVNHGLDTAAWRGWLVNRPQPD